MTNNTRDAGGGVGKWEAESSNLVPTRTVLTRIAAQSAVYACAPRGETACSTHTWSSRGARGAATNQQQQINSRKRFLLLMPYDLSLVHKAVLNLVYIALQTHQNLYTLSMRVVVDIVVVVDATLPKRSYTSAAGSPVVVVVVAVVVAVVVVGGHLVVSCICRKFCRWLHDCRYNLRKGSSRV